MTEIRSALEIALERTAGIEGDKDTLVANERRNDGKRIASRYLVGDDKKFDVPSEFKSFSESERFSVREGFFQTLLANLSLPSDDSFSPKLKQLEQGLNLVLKDRRQVAHLFQQVDQFYRQYMQTREQVKDQLKEQYEPQLREKELRMSEQMGSEVHLSAENDPEFVSLLAKNLARLEQQYSQALVQVKDEFTSVFKAQR